MLWVSVLIFIFFCGTTSGYYVANDECPNNEEYLTCGSACPLNCTNQEPVACTKNCVAGCFCKPGFLRNKYGACVLVEECFENDYVCGENEEYKSCGSACPRTCSQPEPEACIQVCKEGCFCKSGYCRDGSTNKCIKEDEFPKNECPPNEEYLTCGSACPLNCTNQYDEPVACTANCVAGCFCKPGFLRNKYGACVPVEKCFENDYVCGENEEYNSCGSACPRICSQPEPEACILVCREGCFCKSGYCRDKSTNKCVKEDECSENRCPKNEVYDMCNAGCQPSCNNSSPICTSICLAGCICSPGLMRNADGHCVSVDKCFETGPYNSYLYNYLNAIYRLLYLSYY